MEKPLNNPLTDPPALPHGAPAFDVIRPEHFLPALRYALSEAKKNIEAIRTSDETPSFKNTIDALHNADGGGARILAIFGHMSGANRSPALEEIEPDMDAESVRFASDLYLDEVLFERVRAVHDARDSLKLEPEERRLLEKTYKDFARSGAGLDADSKMRMREISEELAKLSTDFQNNLTKSSAAWNKIIDNEDDLAGIPERVKKSYKAKAEEKGLADKWLIPLSPPPTPVMEYAESRALREEVSRASSTAAWKDDFDNSALILDIVRLHDEQAKLLGYKNHSAYVLENRMAKTPDTVIAFLNENEAIYKPAAEKALQELRDFAQATDGLTDFKPWDFMFYERKLKEKTFSVDMEETMAYLDLDKVLKGLREHAEKLFNIEIAETSGKYPVYDQDVKVYEVKDRASGDTIGLFYGDYYAKEGVKRGGAWMSAIRDRGVEDGVDQIPIVMNTCNFDKPPAGQPSLLSMDDVRTVFHEFGHGLHALLAEAKYSSLAGTNVKWDFVELPSQLQENWAQQKEVLDTFATHYKTGEKMPAELIEKIHEMETFHAGYWGQRQTFLGKLDMAWYTADPATIKGVEDIEDKVTAESGLFPRQYGSQSTRFSHIFGGGYSSGYYSYKWAEVLDADVFSAFEQKGLYDRELGDKLRATIYSKGNTKDPDQIYVDMMGREPDPNALFRREGLQPQQEKKELNKAKPAGPKP